MTRRLGADGSARAGGGRGDRRRCARGCRSRWPSWPPAPRPTRSFPLATLAGELREARGDRSTPSRAATRDRRARGVLLVVPDAEPRRGPAVPAARVSTPARTSPSPPRPASPAFAPPQVRRTLAELTRANLLTEHSARPVHLPRPAPRLRQPSWPTFTIGPAEQPDAAVHRMLDHYLHTAHTADHRLLNPHRDLGSTGRATPVGVVVEPLADDQQASPGSLAEHAVLLAAVGQAATTGFDSTPGCWPGRSPCTTSTAAAIGTIGLATQDTALAAARRLADVPRPGPHPPRCSRPRTTSWATAPTRWPICLSPRICSRQLGTTPDRPTLT